MLLWATPPIRLITRQVRAACWKLFPLLLLGCSDRIPSWCIPPDGRVAIAFSAGSGEWERNGRRAHLIKIWRSGPEGGFRYPVAVAASTSGRLAVLDFGSAQVYGFASDGVLEGEMLPPRVVEGPVAITWNEEEELVVFDALASKVLFVAPGEQVLRELRVDSAFLAPVGGAGMSWAGVSPDGTTFLHPLIDADPSREDMSRQETVVLRLAPGSTKVDTIAVQEARTLAPGINSNLPAPGWPFPRLVVGPHGRVAMGGMDSHYRIVVHDSSGGAIRQVCRDAEGDPLRADERGLQGDSQSSTIQALRRVAKPDQPAPYARLLLSADEELWVQRDRPDPTADEVFGRAGARYDVFDPEGVYLGEVRAPDGISLQAVAGDVVWGFDSSGGTTDLAAYRLELSVEISS